MEDALLRARAQFVDRLTIWEAAAHPSALRGILIGAVVVLPFIVGYTAFS